MSLHHKVDSYGSKIGVPIALRGTPAQKYCVEDEVVEPSKELTVEQFQRVEQLCARYKTRKVLIRPTERSDWRGMVDVFRSPTCEVSLQAINTLIGEVREHCRLVWVQDYLAAEHAMLGDNKPYNADNVHIQVVPRIREPWGMVTEHPNYEDVYLIDVTGEESFDVQPIDSYDIVRGTVNNRGGKMETFGLKDQLGDLVQMVRNIRETGELDDDVAHQFEFGIDPSTKQPLQFQIRDLATRRNNANEPQIAERSYNDRIRNFGSFDGSLVVQRGTYRYLATNAGEDQGQDYVMAPEEITDPLSNDFRFPSHLRGFVPNSWNYRKQSLIHQNTRFVQICLRRDGFAILSDRAFVDLPKDQETVHVVCGNGELEINA